MRNDGCTQITLKLTFQAPAVYWATQIWIFEVITSNILKSPNHKRESESWGIAGTTQRYSYGKKILKKW